MTGLHGNGGPAFPHQKSDGSAYWGMSLRDWFAGQALTALTPACLYVGETETNQSFQELASRAYRTADAMLAARRVQE